MSQETDEKVLGSLVLGIAAGAASFFVTALIVTLIGFSAGRVKLIIFPQSISPRPIES